MTGDLFWEVIAPALQSENPDLLRLMPGISKEIQNACRVNGRVDEDCVAVVSFKLYTELSKSPSKLGCRH